MIKKVFVLLKLHNNNNNVINIYEKLYIKFFYIKMEMGKM